MTKKAVKKVSKPRVPKTRNSETMTESAFWSWIRSTLRRASMRWKPISEAKIKARRPKPKSAEGRHKYEYKCANCKKYYPEKIGKKKMIEADHIEEVGSLRCAEDLPGFVTRLFCEVDGFQILCVECHDIKTHKREKSNE